MGLELEDERVWLASDDEAERPGLLAPHPDELTDPYAISKRVTDPGNDSPDGIEPIDIGDQPGLEEFGCTQKSGANF